MDLDHIHLACKYRKQIITFGSKNLGKNVSSGQKVQTQMRLITKKQADNTDARFVSYLVGNPKDQFFSCRGSYFTFEDHLQNKT